MYSSEIYVATIVFALVFGVVNLVIYLRSRSAGAVRLPHLGEMVSRDVRTLRHLMGEAADLARDQRRPRR